MVAPRPRRTTTDVNSAVMVSLSGKVMIDDGSALTESATIQSICRGQKRNETRTDSHGNFSFQVGSRAAASTDPQFDAETSSISAPNGRPERRDLQGCELQAALPGFTSNSVQLTEQSSTFESIDVGRIVLHRLANVEGFTISATTAQAPDSARKAFEKAQAREKDSKWDEAHKLLEKAVAIYPRFAAAWFELGRVQLQKNDPVAARNSFQQSIAADSKYVSPYFGLTQLDQREQKWPELLEVSTQLLALNPVSYPDAWLSNSVANYFLKNIDAAEKSARRGLQVDPEHHVPKLEYVLGMILMIKPDYPGAAEHLRTFLTMTTEPAEVAEAQKQLNEIARLTAASIPK